MQVVETSSGVVPVKEVACIALEYVDSVWIPLHQPAHNNKNNKCRTFCLTYTTYGSRKYRQRHTHILDPPSLLLPPSPGDDAEEDDDLNVNPEKATLFLQVSERAREQQSSEPTRAGADDHASLGPTQHPETTHARMHAHVHKLTGAIRRIQSQRASKGAPTPPSCHSSGH
jgi:hypothetical protein